MCNATAIIMLLSLGVNFVYVRMCLSSYVMLLYAYVSVIVCNVAVTLCDIVASKSCHYAVV